MCEQRMLASIRMNGGVAEGDGIKVSGDIELSGAGGVFTAKSSRQGTIAIKYRVRNTMFNNASQVRKIMVSPSLDFRDSQ